MSRLLDQETKNVLLARGARCVTDPAVRRAARAKAAEGIAEAMPDARITGVMLLNEGETWVSRWDRSHIPRAVYQRVT